jgi:TRAP-type C4-dicarboxylate transport system permease small subunit
MAVRFVETCFHLFKAVIALFLALTVVLVFGNVVLRYASNTGLALIRFPALVTVPTAWLHG